MTESEFDRLERFVNSLLERYDKLQDEYIILEKLLIQRDEEIVDLKQKMDSAENDRSTIGRRVKQLIDQIEEWERGLDAQEQEPEAQVEVHVEKEVEVDYEDVPEEKEGGTQRNLF